MTIVIEPPLIKSPSNQKLTLPIKRKTVAIDIDDTLTSFGDLAKKVIWDKYRDTGDIKFKSYVYANLNHWRTPTDILTLEQWLDVIEICHSNENILANNPFIGAVNVINKIAEKNDICYVSNRAPSTYVATREWLSKNGFPNPESVTCLEESKISFFNNEGVDFIIDDRPKTLVEFVYGGENRKGFGLMTEYNSSLTDVDNIFLAHDWYGLAYFFEKEGVI